MAKIQLSKLVIEFLSNSPEATYEDLLNHMQTAPPLNGQVGSFTEDTLLRHSQFIVDQVRGVLNQCENEKWFHHSQRAVQVFICIYIHMVWQLTIL